MATEIIVGNTYEHITKESFSGYPHDKKYFVLGFARSKDIETGEWYDSVRYAEVGKFPLEEYIREKQSFINKFKEVK